MNLPGFSKNLPTKINRLEPALKPGKHSVLMPSFLFSQIMNPEAKRFLGGFFLKGSSVIFSRDDFKLCYFAKRLNCIPSNKRL
jgi:hypothetical protein